MADNNLSINTQYSQANSRIKPANSVFQQFMTSNIAENKTLSNLVTNYNTFVYPTVIKDPKQKEMYDKIKAFLSERGQKSLEAILRTGKLLANGASDGSTTLENLYNIVSKPRTSGLKNTEILEQTVITLANPYIINQNFGKVPDFLLPSIINDEKRSSLSKGLGLNPAIAQQYTQAQVTGPIAAVTPEDINFQVSGTCVAASLEFNLAYENPAEYARYAEGLTSPSMEVKTKIKLSNLAPNNLSAIELLNNFKTEYEMLNQEEAVVSLKPDKNAYVRAKIEEAYKLPNTRSMVDTLMQSTFMQLGSANGYNTMNDKRTGNDIPDNKGLIDEEKDFVESIVNNNVKKVDVPYQIVDEFTYLKGYNFDFETTKKHIMDSLDAGINVIAGITRTEDPYKRINSKIIGGHEITITGYQYDKNNELYFKYNDTDDDSTELVRIKASKLIPDIHHAGIPLKFLNIPDEDPNYQILDMFQEIRNQHKAILTNAQNNYPTQNTVNRVA